MVREAASKEAFGGALTSSNASSGGVSPDAHSTPICTVSPSVSQKGPPIARG
jgi:hypothetical protein